MPRRLGPKTLSPVLAGTRFPELLAEQTEGSDATSCDVLEGTGSRGPAPRAGRCWSFLLSSGGRGPPESTTTKLAGSAGSMVRLLRRPAVVSLWVGMGVGALVGLHVGVAYRDDYFFFMLLNASLSMSQYPLVGAILSQGRAARAVLLFAGPVAGGVLGAAIAASLLPVARRLRSR